MLYSVVASVLQNAFTAGEKQKKGSRNMLEAYFVSGAGEFVEEFFVYCQSVFFDASRSCWVCEKVSGTSDDDGEISFLRLFEPFVLKSVNLIA